jgi:hypothetical protein
MADSPLLHLHWDLSQGAHSRAMLSACLALNPPTLMKTWTDWLVRIFPPFQNLLIESHVHKIYGTQYQISHHAPLHWNAVQVLEALQSARILQMKQHTSHHQNNPNSDDSEKNRADVYYCSPWLLEKFQAVMRELCPFYSSILLSSSPSPSQPSPALQYAIIDILGVLYSLEQQRIATISCTPLPLVLEPSTDPLMHSRLLIRLPVMVPSSDSTVPVKIQHTGAGLALLRTLLHGIYTDPDLPDSNDPHLCVHEEPSLSWQMPPMILMGYSSGYHCEIGQGEDGASSLVLFPPLGHPHVVVRIGWGQRILLRSKDDEIFANSIKQMPASVPVRTSALPLNDNSMHANTPAFSASTRDLTWSQLILLETNVDDITAEQLSFCVTTLLRQGAVDAWVTPIVMKKGRAAHTLSCLCRPEQSSSLLPVIFTHSTTLGIRIQTLDRVSLPRKIVPVQTEWQLGTTRNGWVDVKVAYFNHRIVSCKAEYNHCHSLALEVNQSIQPIAQQAEWLARRQVGELESLDSIQSTPANDGANAPIVDDELLEKPSLPDSLDLNDRDTFQETSKLDTDTVGQVISEDWSVQINNFVDEVKKL